MEFIPILFPAFIAGLLVVVTHIPLGKEVLRRGIVFIDLALAQTAALGSIVVTWAFYKTGHHGHDHFDSLLIFLASYGASIICASMLYFIRKAPAKIQEGLIGSIFILSSSTSILLLSEHPQGGEHLKNILVGQILWVRWQDVIVACVVTAIVLVGLYLFRKNQNQFIFYPTLAVAITLSTQLVGVYLVFATLIIPALAIYSTKRSLLFAYLVGILGYTSGLYLSVLMDFPSGSVIVLALAFSGLLVWMLTGMAIKEKENPVKQ